VNDDLYDVTPPPQKKSRSFPNPSPETAPGGEELGNANSWRRRSSRPRAPINQAADMRMWDEIDEEEYDMGLESPDSD